MKGHWQVLRIEVDGCHPVFHGNHTPGICDVLRQITDELDRCGVQLIRYPFEVKGEDGTVVARVHLDEGGSGDRGIMTLDNGPRQIVRMPKRKRKHKG